ncbi:MAG: hypothetical protein E7395_05800 [Ruminococcaceae bacterium]|nr:hypothetical protein [Oscillospiraceae bacterium]
MDFQKKQMKEAAVLYYEKKHTQSEIAKIMNLSRQTVSKLLNDAIREQIVEIKINDPETTCTELEQAICDEFKIKNAVVCGVSSEDESLCLLMTVKKAANFIQSIIEKGNQKIAISWGRTISLLISEFGSINCHDNIVFPLFGATDQEQSYFLSNELARSFADKIGSKVKYAWFPYRPDSLEDCELFKKTSYYKKLHDLWCDIDLAIIGIGNNEIIKSFEKIFGYNEKCISAIGDISTHFFNEDGKFLDIYENTLCASEENLKNARHTVAIASGEDKTEAIVGALRTHIIDTLIVDEYTARRILSFLRKKQKGAGYGKI